jgi:hypothetical protein
MMGRRSFTLGILVLFLFGLTAPVGAERMPTPQPPEVPVVEQPGPKQRVVHHRPGSAPKFGDPVAYAAALEAGASHHLARGNRATPHAALMANGVITDPMRGAYLVAPSQQLMLLGALPDPDSVGLLSFDTDDQLRLYPRERQNIPGLSNYLFAAVSADLDGGNVHSLVTAELGAEGCAYLATYTARADLTFVRNGVATTCMPYAGGYVVLAAGYLYDGSTGGEQIVFGMQIGSRICLQLFDPRPPLLAPKGFTCVTSDAVHDSGAMFDLAVGDLNGDGSEELVVAWLRSDRRPMVSIYHVDDHGNFQPTLPSPAQISNTPGDKQIMVKTADIDGNGNEEIVVVSRSHLGEMHILRASFDLNSLSTVQHFPWGFAHLISIAVGRFITEDRQGISTKWQILVLLPATRSPFGLEWALIGLNPLSDQITILKTGIFDFPVPNTEIIELTAASGTFHLEDDNPQRAKSQFAFAVRTLPLDPTFIVAIGQSSDSGDLSIQSQYSLPNPNWYSYWGMVDLMVGDWLGRSVRLGPPTYHFEPDVLQVQAVIYEPPQHIDVFPAPTYTITVNFNPNPNVVGAGGTYVEYNNQTTKTSRQTVSWGNTFQLSISATLTFGNKQIGNYIEVSARGYGGADFQQSQSEYKIQTFGENVRANTDSLFVVTEASFDVWEYPIIRNGQTEGHFVIIRPRKNPLDNGKPCIVNCTVAGGIPTIVPGRSFTQARPEYEPGNLLSWQVGVQATDVLTPIFNSSFMSNQGPNDWFMSYSDIQTTVKSTKWWAGVDLKVSGAKSQPPILNLFAFSSTFAGEYRHEGNTTYEIGFNESTGLKFFYNNPRLSGSYFNVSSLVYWATPFPYLRVNYLLNVPTDPTTIWGSYYGRLPDLTMILRHRARYFTEVKPRLRYLESFSEDIRFSPAAVAVGQPVTITGTVRNYSYAPVAGTVPIVFYRGNPSEGGVPIGQANLKGLAPLSAADVHLQWTPPAGSHGCFDIWMVIDPEGTIQEIHRDNNRGFNMLAVFTSTQPQQDNPCSGSAGPVPHGAPTVAFRPEGVSGPPELGFRPGDLRIEPSTSPTRTLVATVRAQNAHFANVHVTFFDGDPKRGGTHIGAQVLPLVWAGRTAEASVSWPTSDKYGTRDLYARVGWFSPDHGRYDDNLVKLTVQLPPWPFGAYLPAVPIGRPVGAAAVLPTRPSATTRRRLLGARKATGQTRCAVGRQRTPRRRLLSRHRTMLSDWSSANAAAPDPKALRASAAWREPV